MSISKDEWASYIKVLSVKNDVRKEGSLKMYVKEFRRRIDREIKWVNFWSTHEQEVYSRFKGIVGSSVSRADSKFLDVIGIKNRNPTYYKFTMRKSSYLLVASPLLLKLTSNSVFFGKNILVQAAKIDEDEHTVTMSVGVVKLSGREATKYLVVAKDSNKWGIGRTKEEAMDRLVRAIAG